MKAIVVILVVAIILLAVVALLRKKQANSLSAEIERLKSALFDAELEYRQLKDRVTCLCAEKPKTVTPQYLAMKLSALLGNYIKVDGDNCYLQVLAPPTEPEDE